jgi:hypothetical protein
MTIQKKGAKQFPEVTSTTPVLAIPPRTLSQVLVKPTYGATSGGKRRT